jgi:hypothetical protein
LSNGVVAADGFRSFGGEPDFTCDEGEAVRSAKRSEIDCRQRLLIKEIDDRERVEGAKAII